MSIRLLLAKQVLHYCRRQFHTSLQLQRNAPKSPRSRNWARQNPQSYKPNEEHPSNNPDDIRLAVARRISNWKESPLTQGRFRALGLDTDINEVLDRFARIARQELVDGDVKQLNEEHWDLERIAEDMKYGISKVVDNALSSRFVTWAAHNVEDPTARQIFTQLRDASDFRKHTWNYAAARTMKRKVIMHVGPTNSGKTYRALQKLRAARTGFYAGPLRLLAHEVFERLNKGLITPAEGGDLSGNHGRICNLRTGEDIRIVDEEAGLVSCTVEMLQMACHYDVGIVDEIQLIADPYRGAAWTAAVLGATCNELHLCGEEAAVPLIRALLAETGDEIVVHRYERLSPLEIADESLNGNWKNIRKGDCVVTFSRSDIFLLKKRIERETGLKCAVAYGRLPPESRAEQASLFNDPSSGYDVLVASDAIGLGLNLRIKRIIFETIVKFDGEKATKLSTAQIKQIGGRAGRFGLHTPAETETGIVTTFYSADLPAVKKAILQPGLPSIKRAVISWSSGDAYAVSQLIPDHVSVGCIYDILSSCSILGKHFTFSRQDWPEKIDRAVRNLTLSEMHTIGQAPCPYHEPLVSIWEQYIYAYKTDDEVKVTKCLDATDWLNTLFSTKELFDSGNRMSTQEAMVCLDALESLHKALVVYTWLAIRFPASFVQREEATVLRQETERLIDFCLENMGDELHRRRPTNTETRKRPVQNHIFYFDDDPQSSLSSVEGSVPHLGAS